MNQEPWHNPRPTKGAVPAERWARAARCLELGSQACVVQCVLHVILGWDIRFNPECESVK